MKFGRVGKIGRARAEIKEQQGAGESASYA